MLVAQPGSALDDVAAPGPGHGRDRAARPTVCAPDVTLPRCARGRFTIFFFFLIFRSGDDQRPPNRVQDCVGDRAQQNAGSGHLGRDYPRRQAARIPTFR